MSFKRIRLDELPAALAGADRTLQTSQLIEETEHNVEDVLLCMQAMRTDDVPSISWSWEEQAWQPELINEEHYPQFFAREPGPPNAEYRAIWSVPLCRRDRTRQWHDGERYLEGSGRQVLLFDYALHVAAGAAVPPKLMHDSLAVVMGLHESTPLRRAFASAQGNRIKVDAPLLVQLTQWIDELKDYLRLEHQVLGVLARRASRHDEHNLHTNE